MSEVVEHEQARESCAQCGFDSHLYDRADIISSQTIIPAVLRAAAEGLDREVLATRPDDATWSIVEYVDHVREVAFGNRFAIESALASPGVDLGGAPDTALQTGQKDIDFATALDQMRDEYQLLHEVLQGLDDAQWRAGVTVAVELHTVEWFGRHVLHDGIHHMADIGPIRHRLGHGAASVTGAVVSLNVSEGGVPKQPVESAVVGPRGVGGDSQADRRHHGRPVQAVCLWSEDVILRLIEEGHPIAAGAAGENITLAGVDWAELRPGARIDVGPVPMLISAHAVPCAKNAQWFTDRDFNRISHERHPGSSRLYAIPLGSGKVSVGDPVVVEP